MDDTFPLKTATDMTLVLGAQSLLPPDERHNRKWASAVDPWSEWCFRTYVDLLLSSDQMYFALPNTYNKGIPPLISGFRNTGLLKKHPKAAIELTSETEAKVLEGFFKFAKAQRAKLGQWLEFQIVNEIVTIGHRLRADGMIPKDAYEIWQAHADKIRASGVVEQIGGISTYRRWYFRDESKRFASREEFFSCYAFSVYRRGWQYMNSISNMGGAYFPHILRENALTSSTGGWNVEDTGQRLWSWGQYFLQLFEAYPLERSSEKVIERILKIHETMQQYGRPTWGNFPPDHSEIIEQIAKETNLQLLPIREVPEILQRLTNIDVVIAILGQVFGYKTKKIEELLNLYCLTRIFTYFLAPEVVHQIQIHYDQKMRQGVNMVYRLGGFKPLFGYPGLQHG